MRLMVPVRDLTREMCSTSAEDAPRDPVSVFVMPLVCTPARDNELDRVLSSEIFSARTND